MGRKELWGLLGLKQSRLHMTKRAHKPGSPWPAELGRLSTRPSSVWLGSCMYNPVCVCVWPEEDTKSQACFDPSRDHEFRHDSRACKTRGYNSWAVQLPTHQLPWVAHANPEDSAGVCLCLPLLRVKCGLRKAWRLSDKESCVALWRTPGFEIFMLFPRYVTKTLPALASSPLNDHVFSVGLGRALEVTND